MTTPVADNTTSTETPATASQPAAAEVHGDAALEAGLDAGIAAVAPPPPAPAEQPAAPDAAPTAEAVAAEPAPTGDGNAAAPAPAAPPEPAPDEEIKTLGLKERAATRFRELAEHRVKFRPFEDALADAGVESPEVLHAVFQRSQDFGDLVGMIQDTGANPEQYGAALDLIKLINRANAGDAQSAQAAYDALTAQVSILAKSLGKPAAGYDPVAEFPDLVTDVEGGDITRERAEEIAASRHARAMDATRSERAQAEQSADNAVRTAVAELDSFGESMKASDPQFVQKLAILQPQLQAVRENVAPERWLATVKGLYAGIRLAPVHVPPGPVRSATAAPPVSRAPATIEEALDLGISRAG